MEVQTKIIKTLFCILCANPFFQIAQTQTSAQGERLKRDIYLSDNAKKEPMDFLIDSVLKNYMMSSEHCGISIGISQNGKDYFYNYGEVKIDSKTITTKKTVYEIGALSSTFCGLLLAQAIIENKIKVEDDIRNYLPGEYPALEFHKFPIQVKQLINHTSGLPAVPEDLTSQEGYDPSNPYGAYTKEKLLNYLRNTTLTKLPGSSNDYSSLGVAVLGAILEHVYSKSIEDLLKEKIYPVCGMKNTGMQLSANQSKLQATGYDLNGELTAAWSLDVFASAGGLKSNVEDMLSYIKYNVSEKDSAVKLTHTSVYSGKANGGILWQVTKTKAGNKLYSQSGGTFGFGAFNAFIIDKNISVVILSNNGGSLEYIGLAILNELQK
jgi:CubicO group peptidase (beta-lactamase class C family)